MTEIVEVLVPRQFQWWTFLALSVRSDLQDKSIKFVRNFSLSRGPKVIDSQFLHRELHLLHNDLPTRIICWDADQSLSEIQGSIKDFIWKDIALWTVGNIDPCPMRNEFLFEQSAARYDARYLFSNKNISRFEFPNALGRLMIVRRMSFITAKVILQLVTKRQLTKAIAAQVVFCGQSGRETLRKYCSLSPEDERVLDNVQCCAFDQVLSVIRKCLQQAEACSSDKIKPVIIRSAVRFFSLCIVASSNLRTFFTFHPEANINLYQSKLLKHATFLDFGGINGSEHIYPRSADIILSNKQTVRLAPDTIYREEFQNNLEDWTELERRARMFSQRLQKDLFQRVAPFR